MIRRLLVAAVASGVLLGAVGCRHHCCSTTAAPRGQTAAPPVSKGGAAAPTASPPGFVRVKDGVASGRKPTLDGLDALKRAGYKTVVYLHPAGADVSATRDVVQNKGLSFVRI